VRGGICPFGSFLKTFRGKTPVYFSDVCEGIGKPSEKEEENLSETAKKMNLRYITINGLDPIVEKKMTEDLERTGYSGTKSAYITQLCSEALDARSRKKELSIKVKRGNRENVLQGKHLGGCLQFGYRKTIDGHLEADPKEGPIAQEIFRLYGREEMSIPAIANKLKAEGKRRNDGREISHSTIEKMLKSERYIGVLKCDGARNENAIPALVSKELFDLCQQRRTKRKHKNFAYRGKEDYYLSGKIVCGKCGAMFLGESGTSHTGDVHSYYKCNGAKHHKCDARPIRKERLEELTCSLILGLMADDELSAKLADCIYATQKNEAPEILSMRKRKEVVERKIANLVDAITEGIRTPSTKSALLALEAERDKLDAELGEKTISSKKFSKEEILWAIRELARTGVDTPEQRQALLNNFVKRILIKEDGSIVFEFDLFGYEPTVSMGSEDFKKVRINPSLLRHRSFLRTLYVCRECIVVEGIIPKSKG